MADAGAMMAQRFYACLPGLAPPGAP